MLHCTIAFGHGCGTRARWPLSVILASYDGHPTLVYKVFFFPGTHAWREYLRSGAYLDQGKPEPDCDSTRSIS